MRRGKGSQRMKDEIFSVLQRVGRSFMLPVAILPIAGILLGIAMHFICPLKQSIFGLCSLVTDTGYVGTIIFSIIKRALISPSVRTMFSTCRYGKRVSAAR